MWDKAEISIWAKGLSKKKTSEGLFLHLQQTG